MLRFLLSLILVSLITPSTVVMASVQVPYVVVQQIFKEKCVMCHTSSVMPGKDWSKYEEVVKYKASIKNRVSIKKDMPPAGMSSLTDNERRMIEEWIDLGGIR